MLLHGCHIWYPCSLTTQDVVHCNVFLNRCPARHYGMYSYSLDIQYFIVAWFCPAMQKICNVRIFLGVQEGHFTPMKSFCPHWVRSQWWTCTKSATVLKLFEILPSYRMLVFFEVLVFHEWLIFSFFAILFSQMGLPKAQHYNR